MNLSSKLFATTTLFLLAAGVTFAEDWHVTTEPQFKNILLEEFTGIHCGNCPDGHRIAADLILAQLDRFFAVNIHAGYYADPLSYEPDFRISEGEAINDYFGVDSYPAGIINRHIFEGARSEVVGRSYWNEFARAISKEQTPVNLWMESSYDNATRTLDISVEGYLTEEVKDGTAYLTIYLCQNDIEGPQSGSSLGFEYIHRHMLRDVITSNLPGDLLEVSKGDYFKKEYSYTLPETIGDVETIPTDLELIAFVSEDCKEILNVTNSIPSCEGITLPMKVEIAAYKLPVSLNYGFDFVELYLTNKSSEPVTTAEFEISLNDNPVKTAWEGNIAPRSKQPIILPVNWVEEQEDLNSFRICCVSANNIETESNVIDGSFGMLPVCSTSLKFQIKTDLFASDNTFYLKDNSGNILREFGPYADDETETYEENVNLDPDKIYCLEINDSWADGIMSPRGRVRIYDTSSGEDVIVSQAMEITGHGQRLFFSTSADTGVGTLTDGQAASYDVYNMEGIMVARSVTYPQIQALDLRKGIYLIKETTKNSTSCKKIIIH